MAGLNDQWQNVYQKLLIKELGWPIAGDLSRPGAEFMSIFNSLPNNKVLFDQYGFPGVYVFIPKFNWDPTNGFASALVHPAFIWGGVEHAGFWVAKYQASAIIAATGAIKATQIADWSGSVAGHVAASLPYQDPAVYLNFNAAIDICEAKNSAAMRAAGNIFHLMTNAEWAAVALWCKQMYKDSIFASYCRGNNDYCRDIDNKGITGLPLNETLTIGSNGGSYGAPYYGRWRTGSGGVLSSHNFDPSGIFDMNGNIWEWIVGLQSPDAGTAKQAWIIPDNEAAIATPAQLKDIATAPGAPWAQIGEWNSTTDEDFSKENAANFTPAGAYSDDDAEILALIAHSDVTADYGNDYFYKPDVGENNVPRRGGPWSNGVKAGLFALHIGYLGGGVDGGIGLRSAFVGDLSSVT